MGPDQLSATGSYAYPSFVTTPPKFVVPPHTIMWVPVHTMPKSSRPSGALVREVDVVHASAWKRFTETVSVVDMEPVVPPVGDTCSQGALEIAAQ
jgi:hypothetical protein